MLCTQPDSQIFYLSCSGGRRKLHYLFPDQTELVEERDQTTNELLLRKWKRPKDLGQATWEFEVGEDSRRFDPEQDLMQASSANPIFIRKDTNERFEWRIRNLPYPKDNYIIEVDHQKQQIVLKTVNKKYYKRIEIPDLRRVSLEIDEAAIAWRYTNNTVIISYDKPQAVKARDAEMLRLAARAATTSTPNQAIASNSPSFGASS